jgi:hypothetical protein
MAHRNCDVSMKPPQSDPNVADIHGGTFRHSLARSPSLSHLIPLVFSAPWISFRRLEDSLSSVVHSAAVSGNLGVAERLDPEG